MTRRPPSEPKRQAHQLAQISKALTVKQRIRTACLWVIAEAGRKNQLSDVLLVLLDLAYRLQQNLPLPEPVPGSPAHRWHRAVGERSLADSTTPDRRNAA